MWSRILNIILAVLLVASLIWLTLLLIGNSKLKVVKANLEKELFYCQHAPTTTDTIHDTLRIVEYRTIKPQPKPLPNGTNGGLSQPTTVKCADITPTYYSETYKAKGVAIKWEALSECTGDSAQITFIRFPEILAPKEIVTITKTVLDTINIEVPAKVKSKFLVYGELGANNFNSFPVVGAGIGYLHKQSWFIIGGAMYLDSKAYGTLKVGITF